MSVTEYDFNESNSRFETALDLSRMQAIAAGLSLAADSPMSSDKSDFDWRVDNNIDNIEVVNGKVGGKIPVEEFREIRKKSIKNINSDSMTLGRYTNDSTSYIAKAGKESTYFDLGNEWGEIKKKYNLSDTEMFEYFNKPALDDAINSGKIFRFSHDPRQYRVGALWKEWQYIKENMNKNNSDLIWKGGFLYVK